MQSVESEANAHARRVAQTSDHPSIALVWGAKLQSRSLPDGSAAMFYEKRGRTDVCLFGPLGPEPEARGRLLDDYLRQAERLRRRGVFVQVRDKDVRSMQSAGMVAAPMGRSYSINLPSFSSAGKPLAKVRQNVNRAVRDGVVVAEATRLQDTGRAEIDRTWLEQKGRHARMLRFMVGDPITEATRCCRIFVASIDGEPVAYIVYSPTYGNSQGWLYDLTRRSPHAPVGTIEAINLQALTQFRDEGARWLHLGLTPFVGTPPPQRGCDSVALSSLLWGLGKYGTSLYDAPSQERFKLKWNPHVIESEHICFTPKFSLRATRDLMSIANML